MLIGQRIWDADYTISLFILNISDLQGTEPELMTLSAVVCGAEKPPALLP